MLLENKSKRKYVHSYLDENAKLKIIVLEPNKHCEIPDDVAKSWLKSKEIKEYVNPEEARKAKKALEDENAKLKAELEKIKADETKDTKVQKANKKQAEKK